MTNVSWEYAKNYSNAVDVEKEKLQDQIDATETSLAILRQMQEETGDDIYDTQVATAEKQLEQLQESMKKYETATDDGLNDVEDTWMERQSILLTKLTGKEVEFEDVGMDSVQMYVDGVKSGEPMANNTARNLATSMVKQLASQKAQAEIAGIDYINGVNAGINNQTARSAVFASIRGFGSQMLSTMRKSLSEESPSKATAEMGGYLVEGLEIGIARREKDAIKQADALGKDVLGALNGELSSGVSVGVSGQASTQGSMVQAFKQALSEVEVVLDDEVAGRFVDKTVTKLIYA